MSEQQVLVTGACGEIGQALVQAPAIVRDLLSDLSDELLLLRLGIVRCLALRLKILRGLLWILWIGT